jgi:hypothetical protein
MEDKVAAIYELREAAERHARVELAVGKKPKGKDRDRLLDARIELEEKTQRAVESCVYCGRPHADEERACEKPNGNNVISVDFNHRSDQVEPDK